MDREPTSRASTLHSLAVALWGACVGLYLAALILLPLLSKLTRNAAADSNIDWLPGFYAPPPWQVGYQKWMYIVNGLCCPLAAWLASRWRARFNGWACLLSFVVFVPVLTKVYRNAFTGEPRVRDFIYAALVVGVPLVNWGKLWTLAWSLLGRAKTAEPDAPARVAESLAGASGSGPSLRGLLFGLLLLSGLLWLFFWPRDIDSFSGAFYDEVHLASYFFGPALCFLDPNKVPGLDFESHYGIGHAYLYSFFMGTNYHEALCGYLWFMFAVLCFYFLSAYVVMAHWFRSARTGVFVTLLLLMLSMECLSYRWPSCWPMRFPFLFVFLGCASLDTVAGKRWLAVLLAGACAALSFFWQTDNGLVLMVAGTSYYAALSVRERTGWLRAPLFLLGTAGVIVTLSLLAFGPRTLSIEYYRGLLAPVVEYSSGFGWHLMRWQVGWTYLYNLVGPAIALATIGWSVWRFGKPDLESKRDARFLFLASAVGMMMLFKWANRAMDLAWTMNAAAIVVVLFWWARTAVLAAATSLEDRPGWLSKVRWRPVLGSACVVGLVGLGLLAGRYQPSTGMVVYSDSPLERLHCFTMETPTPANWLLSKVTDVRILPSVPPVVDEADVEFLRQHSKEAESVAVLAELDWVYLAEAHRSAAFHWVPVCYTHTTANVEHVVQDLKQAKTVFVHRESMKKTTVSLQQRLMPILEEEFILVDSGKGLDRYVHKDNAAARAR